MNKQENIHLDPNKLFGLSQALRVEGNDTVREHDLHSKAGENFEVIEDQLKNRKELHTKAGETLS